MLNTNVITTVFGLLIALFGPMLVAITGERLAQSPARLGPHLFGLSALVAITAIVLLIVFRFERKSLSSIGVQPFRWQTVAWGLGLAAFFMYVFAPAAYWTLARASLGSFDMGIAKNEGLPLWYVTIAVILGGIAEEVLYRGYAVERIAALTTSYWLGGLISVLVYGLAHVPMWGWAPALTTVVSGGIFTMFFLWRRDLTANIIAHIVTDFAGIVLAPLLYQGSRY